MKIHNVIFIIYLKLITNPTLNLYEHYFIILSLIIINNKEKYKIKRLIKKRYYYFDRAK